jgi:ribulose-phosphate 3-epimerase
MTQLPLDVHIMVSNPDTVAESYVRAGADSLCFHVEASTHPYRILQMIKKMGVKAGIALNPGTPILRVEPLLDQLDMILLLSVNPGFSGQEFIPIVYEKLKVIKKWKKSSKLKHLTVAIDGGVSTKNIKELVKLGANYFVTGSYFFNSSNKRIAIRKLHESAL